MQLPLPKFKLQKQKGAALMVCCILEGQHRVAEGGVGGLGLLKMGGQIIAEAEQGVDAGDDAFLFGEGWECNWTISQLRHIDRC
jgi:hypothetical protein